MPHTGQDETAMPPPTVELCALSHLFMALEELHPGITKRAQEIGDETFWLDKNVLQLRPAPARPVLLRRRAEANVWTAALALLVDARFGWRKRRKRAG